MRHPRTLLTLACTAVAGGAAAVVLALGPSVGASDAPVAAPTIPPTTAPPTTAAPVTTAPPTTAPPTTVPPAQGETLRPGDRSDAVLALQERLGELGYWLGEPDGHYGDLTEQAVLAFQKWEGLHRDGTAGPATLDALPAAQRPTPGSVEDGVEVDLERQVLLVVSDGRVRWALNTSTGRSGMRTPAGDYVVEREIDGVRDAPLGRLYRPKYFHDGYAVHGSPSIPGYPASHGCARVSNPAMDLLWASGELEVGTPVRVH